MTGSKNNWQRKQTLRFSMISIGTFFFLLVLVAVTIQLRDRGYIKPFNYKTTQNQNNLQPGDVTSREETTVALRKRTICCIGDSITYGEGIAVERRGEFSYPAILEQLTSSNEKYTYQVENFGLSGRTLLSTGDAPYTEESYYSLSLEEAADIYILMLGTNDATSLAFDSSEVQFYEELRNMVEAYQNLRSVPDVYLLQPPKVFSGKNAGAENLSEAGEILGGRMHDVIAEVGKNTGARVIDLYELTKDHPEWFVDGIHPNEEGNQAIAEAVYQAIFH